MLASSSTSNEVMHPSISLDTGLSRALDADQSLTEIISITTSNPSHLFWVPASQHPEIAPAEYEKHVQAIRSNSFNNGKVKRRRSVLSQSFTAQDTIEPTAQLQSLPDLDQARQRALAALEIPSDILHRMATSSSSLHAVDPQARKKQLRRSMSLQLPGDNTNVDIPDFLVFDRHSTTLDQSPILASHPHRPLSRRGARTKFQRGPSLAPAEASSSDRLPEPTLLTGDHALDFFASSDSIPSPLLDIQPPPSPPSSPPLTDNNSNSQQAALPSDITPSPSSSSPTSSSSPPTSKTSKQAIFEQQQATVARHRISPPPAPFSSNSTPKPVMELSKSASTRSKSSWSWSSFWSDEKKSLSSKPAPAPAPAIDEHEPDATLPSSTKQRFGLSSFFSRKSSTAQQKHVPDEVAVPKDFELNPRLYHQNRLPIHMERAIYRLSHMKLANPRRPLHEQVIISNFMFWYLGIISQQQQQHSPPSSRGTPSPPRHHRPNQRSSSPRQHRQPMKPRSPEQIAAASRNKKKQVAPAPPNQAAGSPWHKQERTGFVIPDNYLRPKEPASHPAPLSSLPPSHSPLPNGPHRQKYTKTYARQQLSSDEEEDDPDEPDEDEDDDDVPGLNDEHPTPPKQDTSMYNQKKLAIP
ncbi:hypothetical protein DM01DRAFT_1381181 [Hesseltinella vesiculosa]|uniref:Protein Zds1 C-terminal domain-containing protein n=1 Tax=Hesseltinella vesiculosa TaxID=101127 RepID=A0A1X2GRD8_9FUNG|nr:hypothetical protein DM01DRAFT_1381181 [Hesseltinella vesiculosa]